ncbi:mediator complex subunit MED14 [Colletotrichum karsti]|uniref:Glucose-6-phosphate 1-dehydrogenase n=1 Tax=Colletotrichum karsti TaxID=1095194 RepID=A0A9P6LPM2_9PEZI|nr:mediator complex subunit MED14 [Colletotrichum karsti]KAF9879797.1 mediator complex subunit MED14 [Colletotrichum karsti]
MADLSSAAAYVTPPSNPTKLPSPSCDSGLEPSIATGLRQHRYSMELKDNTVIVVLGASGDLAKKKTYPALFGLYRNQFLPKDIKIVGYARTKMDHDEYIRRIRSYMKTPTKEIEQQLNDFCNLCTYVSGQYDRDDSFLNLNAHLEELEAGKPETHRLFYMALPPSVFTIVSQHLKKCCYPTKGIARVVIEKPFGKDLASSRELQKSLEPDWKEDELFRIDHYLGKEMVKNILILRFGNSFFGSTWNRQNIDNVQITFKEPFGTEGRGGYFDEFGIIRDVMQNHLLQVLTLLAMERPISFASEDIRDEKVRVLRAMPAIEPKNVIIGQYGKSLDGSKPSYKEDDTVPKDSRCPTFCAMVAYIKNERWDGVPFIMKAGKALNEQKTEIRIQFKDVTSGIFKDIPRNELVMRIQPNESVYVKMNSKLPGLSMQTVVTELDLTYRRRFSDLKIPEAYESLILDCLKGDHSNFVRDDELDASWRIFTPLLHYLDDNKEIIPMEYPYGSRGPAVLDDFTSSYGYKFSDAAGYQWPTTSAQAPNKFKGKAPADAPGKMPNGVADIQGKQQSQMNTGLTMQPKSRMNDLPDEIVHITQGYIPLSTIVSRLAQRTHEDLQKVIMEMAAVKWAPPAVNGNTPHGNEAPDDMSEGNKRKKMLMLKFAQDAHAKWVKALVMTDWSKNAEAVSKLIDIKAHIDSKRVLYDFAQDLLIDLKRGLIGARLPNPDLKTALQVLTTGEATWVPEPGYIPPPPLTPEEQLKWIDDLNTMLSLRLNLDDYDKIPHQFRTYSIHSGRVTFEVKGEFEVDLTIADEDFTKQFWFIDFRFAFSPSARKLSDGLVSFLEGQVNEILGKDGLEGCYRFLHEFVLTHKINELKRQALELSRSTWTGTLVVEPLNRALALQYWTTRYGPAGPKSWVMIAVNSAKKTNGQPDTKHSSRLVARWYRDNKEVKDVLLPFDVDNLSAEDLLKTAVARHVDHILSSIHKKLLTYPRFEKRESSMTLKISRTEPVESFLSMQLGSRESVTLVIEPVTGFAAMKPHTKYALSGENRLNYGGKDPAEDGVVCLENIRWGYVMEEFNRRGRSIGWKTCRSPLGGEDIKQLIRTREAFQTIWLQRQGLDQDWHVMVSLSLAGDEWWLIQIDRNTPARPIKFNSRLPLNRGQPDLDDAFWSNLTLFVTGIITHVTELHNVHLKEIKHLAKESTNYSLPQQVQIPSVFYRLSQLLRPTNVGGQSGSKETPNASKESASSWAQDHIEIKIKGLQPQPHATPARDDSATSQAEMIENLRLNTVVDAIIRVKDKSKFALLKGRIDRDVSFSPKKGEFIFRIRQQVGHPILDTLTKHVKSIDRLVGFLEAMGKARGSIKCERMSLREVVFTYSDIAMPGEGNAAQKPRRWRATLDLSKSDVRISLEKGNPHLRVLDLLVKMVNTQDGLKAIIVFMPLLLPILRTFETIESKWEALESTNQGRVQVFARSIDWICIRYTLPSASGQPRILALDIRTQVRRNEIWWHLSRARGDGAAAGSDDEFAKVIKPVWESHGDGWRGLITGAASRPGPSTMDLLTRVDDAVRTHAASVSANGPPSTDGAPTQLSQTFSASQSFGTQPTSVSQSQGSNRTSGSKQAPLVLD